MKDQNRARRPWTAVIALLAVLSLVAAACGNDDDGDAAPDDTPAPATDGGAINIGWIPWDEDIAVTWLWKALLEERGYDIELTQLDVAPVYSGMAQGDIDLFLDGWLPETHGEYWDEFGDDIEDLGVWYDQGILTMAVPAYVDAEAISDLAGRADEFDGQIIGIEPGAGLMRVTGEEVIPGYGLEEYTLVEGSTPAMLAELERAINNEENIIVTLWHPHWAYASFDIRDLEDPEGLLGDVENLHTLARSGFSSDFPEVADWLGNFEMTQEALASLTDLVINEFGTGNEEEAIEEWLSDPDNRALVDSWFD